MSSKIIRILPVALVSFFFLVADKCVKLTRFFNDLWFFIVSVLKVPRTKLICFTYNPKDLVCRIAPFGTVVKPWIHFSWRKCLQEYSWCVKFKSTCWQMLQRYITHNDHRFSGQFLYHHHLHLYNDAYSTILCNNIMFLKAMR